MMPLLSILICTIPERKDLLRELLDNLQPTDEVEILINENTGTIGAKRNTLLHTAKGKFIVFIDDDDEVSGRYIELILAAIQSNDFIDCVGIQGTMSTNGDNVKQWYISKECKKWHEVNGVYYRTPNHISPVRRDLALRAMFPETNHGEDYEYSMRLLPMLKHEVRIEDNIYHYKYKRK